MLLLVLSFSWYKGQSEEAEGEIILVVLIIAAMSVTILSVMWINSFHPSNNPVR